MKFPQSFAMDVAHNMDAIGKYSCLAMCYLNMCGMDGDSEDYIRTVSHAMDRGLLDEECTVLDAEKFISWATGRDVKVKKVNYTDIAEVEGPAACRFTYFNESKKRYYSHWVVVEHGKITFNSLLNSNCVTKGYLAPPKDNDPNTRIIKLR